MHLKWIIALLISLGALTAQMDEFVKNPGYIDVKADTIAVPIYIDGTLIGHTPLDRPVPVLEGIHHITHHPPSFRDPFLQFAKTETVKQLFVLSGDTVHVRLDTQLMENRLIRAKREYHLTNYFGIGFSLLVLWQLWILAN